MGDAFEAAVNGVKALRKDPGNDTKLTLYALYKQATSGDAQGSRPGFTDPIGRFKYDAWAALAGTSSDDAKQQYVDLVERLRATQA
jgi:diazepam-binding inhibitor (GABA receptor modulating acyl-CoA-binding protein)